MAAAVAKDIPQQIADLQKLLDQLKQVQTDDDAILKQIDEISKAQAAGVDKSHTSALKQQLQKTVCSENSTINEPTFEALVTKLREAMPAATNTTSSTDKNKIQELEVLVQARDKYIIELQKQVTDKSTECTKLETQLKTQSARDAEENRKLHQQINSLTATVDKCSETISHKDKEIEELNRKLAETCAQVHESMCDDIKKAKDDLQVELDKIKTSLIECTQKQEKQDQDFVEQEKKYKSLQESLAKLTSDNNDLAQKNAALTKKLEESNELSAKVMTKIDALEPAIVKPVDEPPTQTKEIKSESSKSNQQTPTPTEETKQDETPTPTKETESEPSKSNPTPTEESKHGPSSVPFKPKRQTPSSVKTPVPA